MVGGNAFAKTVCSICYEYLKPIEEDLQVISLCGHVFHELCLQQWFEYCTNEKKHSCPVCKQICSSKNVGRLYFQSIGDPGDPILSRSQNADDDDNREALRRKVTVLEAKLSGFNLALDRHKKDAKDLGEELRICKEQLSKEVMLKNEALKQKESIQQMLQTKTGELVRSTLECSSLQEKNLALAKELAALKLVSDCNLEEDEVLKLASLGNEGNSQDAFDVLKKSLVIRNKSYKELMAKCNNLGRGEARSLRKLERAEEKITKLKTRVQELEVAIEANDNEVLRMLKGSKKSFIKNTNYSSICKHSPEDQKEQLPENIINLDDDESFGEDTFGVKGKNKKLTSVSDARYDEGKIDHNLVNVCDYLIDEDVPEKSETLHQTSSESLNGMKSAVGSDADRDTELWRPNDQSEIPQSRTGVLDYMTNSCSAAQEGEALHLEDIRLIQPSIHSKTDASSPGLLSEPGYKCFAGAMLGPDGATRHLGKWCKRARNKGPLMSSVTTQNMNTDCLIAVGADGRGGRIKVLRSTNMSSVDGLEGGVSVKKCKLGGKTNALQSQRCFQMEHFFGKANH
ncbi:hypothetical protein Nepgr_002314 [Nepenthes gracilis]|uniref:RING-type domain-containing protein n=1 Tax=Nepenthes gracilis TaxID=150966 RepID=A0AAD3P7P0_NEPGR|nr:hypothetical protein Nepgr_002314 [Nepenthes gracilis]